MIMKIIKSSPTPQGGNYCARLSSLRVALYICIYIEF